ncbi:LytR/AlgR family response regulator transcription factor [Pseudobacter ginsenosidimutans]|uniref:LytTR family two component transcriptional regulator n=1 Tax=Pseudobacter ginsenosidimutans TaxID=661488 RepID=A0A4Q7N488_9BACT|nr:LytTR family DNA-binding domain-containing protein [Pseudobacter ginsenosidimutans]QEC44341.1 response regulator transcription factor [Pseudobacter ginsenosidimutans]RZS75805.1 LytTR family two component transcriptional regulator [Pseudobacter ginsenosidimutans]
MNAIIMEDEKLIARQLIDKIAQVAPDMKIVEVLPSVKTATKWFMENSEPDIVFADIQLSDGVSFQVFERYDLKCPIVFTTAYDEYAIRAFKSNGVDYLLKPVDTDDLQKAIEKCRVIVESRSQYPKDIQQLLKVITNSGLHQPGYKEKFIVNHRQQWIPVQSKDIACFYRENLNYILTFGGEKHILDFTTLDEIEELLDPALFYRVNRQAIIHMDAIQSIQLHENQKLTVFLKQPLKMQWDISREKAPAFKKWFDR